MTATLEDLCHAMLDAARKAGAETADAIATSGESLSVQVRAGALEHAERSESTDVGLRVLIGRRQALVSASDSRPETLAMMAERAVAMAREAPEDAYAGLADPGQLAQGPGPAGLEMTDPTPAPSPQALQLAALEAESAALAVAGVTQVSDAEAGCGTHSVHMAATNGFSGGYARSSHWLSCVAIAGTGAGMERDHDSDGRSHLADLRDARQIGRTAGQRAVERLAPRKPATGTYPVLFDERIAFSLVGHLLAAANGAAIARGSSWLLGRLGEAVLPGGVSLIEDPHRPRVGASRPFDGEGLPTARRAIVENGVLTGWTLDLSSARQLGMAPTGNAARGLSSPPMPANWNIELTGPGHSRADLIAGMGSGLLVTAMIGSAINPNTGDYSRGASGLWVENGQIAGPVNECTVAGNLGDMLRRMVLADDARPWLSRVAPSILIEGMTLAGQ